MAQQIAFPFWEQTRKPQSKDIIGLRYQGKFYPVGQPVDLGAFRMVLLPVDYTVSRGRRGKTARPISTENNDGSNEAGQTDAGAGDSAA